MVFIEEDLKGFLGNHKAANYQNVVQDLLTSYKAVRWNMSLKIHFLSHTWIFFPQNQKSQWRKLWKISPRHYGYDKAVSRQVDLKYFGRLLLESEEGCTWSQITAKVVSLFILEESFCLSHEHVKCYFAHLNSSVSLKPCLIGNFYIHIWIKH